MNIGMLWFDNDSKVDLATRIQRAASYYRAKYSRAPNLCFVHPSMLGTTPVITNGSGIEVRTTRTVLPTTSGSASTPPELIKLNAESAETTEIIVELRVLSVLCDFHPSFS